MIQIKPYPIEIGINQTRDAVAIEVGEPIVKGADTRVSVGFLDAQNFRLASKIIKLQGKVTDAAVLSALGADAAKNVKSDVPKEGGN